MAGRKKVSRAGLGAVLVAALAVLPGCAEYLAYRGKDAAEMLEVGFTVTETPYLGLYACGGGIATGGASKVDGHLLGIGGGRVGWIRHYQKTLGLVLWSYEDFGWGDDFDVAKAETLDCHHIGILGWIMYPQRRPGYAPA